MTSRHVLVFGASGGLGEVIAERFEADGDVVLRSSRQERGVGFLRVDPFGEAGLERLAAAGNLDAVVWAQGTNINDTIGQLDLDAHRRILEANCFFVSHTLNALLRAEQLIAGSRLCVVSSIWQELARQDKYSYIVSKAAIAGLVRAAAVDLATRNILINAVLPGVVDTPMTRAVLTPEQIRRFEEASGFGRIVTATDVTEAVWFLCSPLNNAISGQFLAVDLGYSHGRLV